MKTAIKIDSRVKVSLGNKENVNLKIFAAKEGLATCVKSKSNGRKSYFIGLQEVAKDEFLGKIKEPIGHDSTDQYLAGVPCVWDIFYYSLTK